MNARKCILRNSQQWPMYSRRTLVQIHRIPKTNFLFHFLCQILLVYEGVNPGQDLGQHQVRVQSNHTLVEAMKVVLDPFCQVHLVNYLKFNSKVLTHTFLVDLKIKEDLHETETRRWATYCQKPIVVELATLHGLYNIPITIFSILYLQKGQGLERKTHESCSDSSRIQQWIFNGNWGIAKRASRA